MIVGESRCFQISASGHVSPAPQHLMAASTNAVRDMLELLKPQFSPEELLDKAEESLEGLLEEVLPGKATPEAFEMHFRLHESLFFNPRMAIHGAHEGRAPRKHLLMRLAKLIIGLLKTDPLKGEKKHLAKYFLQASKGPNSSAACAHVFQPWEIEDNRATYRSELMEAVSQQLGEFAAACNELRAAIDECAAQDGGEEPDAASAACASLCRLPNDRVKVPTSWREDPFWEVVQLRGVLRFDPGWAQEITDGASCCLQLLRLGVPLHQEAGLPQDDATCSVTNLAKYSELRQVRHAPMQELFARGYVTYSHLCNKKFQDKMKQVAQRAAKAAGLEVGLPEETVAAKRLPRIMEKTREAQEERSDWAWPGRREDYLPFSHCFYILDTVRMSVVCGGASVPEQTACCMRLLEEFAACTTKADGVCLLRQKSGFADGVNGAGGYADVKMLCYADLGVHHAFDGTEIPLQIIGEVQLILEDYKQVKDRMHLVYEVNRGSFD
ncbi:unnamed protein product [Polarella glacialis]|uniref:Uncharacterized protein n=1 Tax=Polarella glacialis TaxID=89957 RepID=A0A813D5H6_POLGL|nr:unnamed protein product [Polarella glacialis]